MNKHSNELGTRQVKPAYVAYKTFAGFIEGLKANGIPNRIDRSVMPNMSGGNQAQLLSALKFLDLITEHGTVKEKLSKLVKSDGEERKKILHEIVVTSYPFLVGGNFIKTATTKQLEDKFKETGISGNTLQKAMTFFTHLAKDAELEVSTYIKPYRHNRRAQEHKQRKTNDNSMTKNEKEAELYFQQQTAHTWAQLLLSKFPEFDPSWNDEIKKKWFEDFEMLMKMGEQKTEEERG